MKLKKSIIATLLLIYNVGLNAQENKTNDVEQMKIQLQKDDVARKARIDQFVKKFNFPISGYNDKGDYFFIHHIDEQGIPIYFETKGNQNDSMLKIYSEVNSVSKDAIAATGIQSQSIKKNRNFKLESMIPISSVTVISDKGKIQFTNQAIAKNNFELKMAKWMDGQYSIIIKLQNNQTYLTNIKL